MFLGWRRSEPAAAAAAVAVRDLTASSGGRRGGNSVCDDGLGQRGVEGLNAKKPVLPDPRHTKSVDTGLAGTPWSLLGSVIQGNVVCSGSFRCICSFYGFVRFFSFLLGGGRAFLVWVLPVWKDGLQSSTTWFLFFLLASTGRSLVVHLVRLVEAYPLRQNEIEQVASGRRLGLSGTLSPALVPTASVFGSIEFGELLSSEFP